MKKILFFLLIFSFTSLIAMKVAGLYEANVPITSQDDAAREKGFQQGLKQVLIKVSGNSHIADQSSFAQAIKSAANVVDGYSYQSNTDPTQNFFPYILTISFPAPVINNLLSGGVWPNDRPVVLMWIVIQDKQGQRLVGSESMEPLSVSIKKITQQRGVFFIFPSLDLTDLNQLSVNDVVTNNIANIQVVSKRYEYDAILIGKVTQNTDASWSAQWQLLYQQPQQWQFAMSDLNQLVTTSFNQIVDVLAQQILATRSTAQNTVTLTVNGINQLDQYVKATDYLQHIVLVKELSVQQVNPTSVQFKLTINGTGSDLQKIFSNSEHLSAIDMIVDSELTCFWQ